MSKAPSAVVVAVLVLVGSAGAGRAQNAPVEVANVPPASAAQDSAPPARPSIAPQGRVSSAPDTAAFGSLSENSFNFTDPDSIPGFGSLPKDLDTTPLRPVLSE